MANYDGLTPIFWPGTWRSYVDTDYPIVVDQDLRGTLQFITGDSGDQLTDISGKRLEEGMLVYLKNGYSAGPTTRTAETYYQYKALAGESRDLVTGELPNAEANWTQFKSGDDNNLIFATPSGQPNKRRLVQYKELGTTYIVRAADTNGNMLNLTLATFTPTFSVTVTQSSTPNWDVPCTGFIVSVGNPADFTTQYISSVNAITNITAGDFTALNLYSTTGPSPAPAGGVNWSQTFTTDNDSYIRPTPINISGGSASARLQFNVTDTSGTTIYAGGTASLTVNWKSPSISIRLTSCTGKTFLEAYTSTIYTITVGNLSNPSSYTVLSVQAILGTASFPPTGTGFIKQGTLSFSSFGNVTIDTPPNSVTISADIDFIRPASVTGFSYTAPLGVSDGLSVSFTYPSFWLIKMGPANNLTVPISSDIITGSNFNPEVNRFQNDITTKNFGEAQPVNNTTGNLVSFWFGVVTSINGIAVAQPTSFTISPDNGTYNNIDGVVYGTVSLQSAGTTSVQYNLYGITIQNNTNPYIRIR